VTPPAFTEPPEDARIWRYLELPALVHVLSSRSLHFTRPDKFTDRFEGSLSRLSWEWTVGRAHPDIRGEYGEVRWREDRKSVAINCWHVSDYESLAMWSLYGRAVALQTTFARLMFSTGRPAGLSVGMVEYIDHETDGIPTHNAYAHYYRKRKSFAHERELRLILSRQSDVFAGNGGKFAKEGTPEMADPGMTFQVRCGAVPDEGLDLPADPKALIEAIYIAPESPDWIINAVTTVVTSLGYEMPVKRSALDASPIY
jgi:hypothetical protein